MPRITQLAGGRAWIKCSLSESAEVGSLPPGLALVPITSGIRLGYPAGVEFPTLILFSRRGIHKPRVSGYGKL